MKMIIISAVLGLSASAAMADCAGHMPINAAADVDRTLMTASVMPDDAAPDEQLLVLKKGDRLPEALKQSEMQ